MSPHYFNPSHPQQVPASPLILLFLPSCLPICCELCINLSLRRSVNRCGVNQSLGFPFISLSSQWLKREKKEEEEGVRLHYQHTHTHTGYITLWKRCGSSGKSGPRVFPLLPSFFDCFLWFSSSFCFYPSSDEQLRGCIFKHHGVSLRCLSPKYLLVLKKPNNNCVFFHLHIHHLISFPFSSSYFPPPSNLSTRTLKDARSFVSGTTEEISSLTFLNVLFHVESFLRERGGRRVLTSNRKKERKREGRKKDGDEILTRGLFPLFMFSSWHWGVHWTSHSDRFASHFFLVCEFQA